MSGTLLLTIYYFTTFLLPLIDQPQHHLRGRTQVRRHGRCDVFVRHLPETRAKSTNTTPCQRQILLRAASSLGQPQPASASWQVCRPIFHGSYVSHRHHRHPPLRCLLRAGMRLYARQAARRREDGGHGFSDDSSAPTVHSKCYHQNISSSCPSPYPAPNPEPTLSLIVSLSLSLPLTRHR